MEIYLTDDGSTSIYNPNLKEFYHSIHGAIQESQYIYIDCGLLSLPPIITEPTILEIGFGTGLNAFLTYLTNQKKNLVINYQTIENTPLTPGIIAKLNYTKILKVESQANIFNLLHNSKWNQAIQISPGFRFKKYLVDLKNINLNENYYNLIYFDAFGPEIQPELWTTDIFVKLYQALKPQGIIITYSAKGQVKRNLKKSGFIVENMPGPQGKREITKGIKKINSE